MRRLTQRDSIAYIKKISIEARKYGLSTGLKNAQEIISRVSDDVQFAVNEECSADGERQGCNEYRRMLNPSGRSAEAKPVFHIEYVNTRVVRPLSRVEGYNSSIQYEISSPKFRNMTSSAIRNRLCLTSKPDIGDKMSTVIKVLRLDGWIMTCDGKTTVTKTRNTPKRSRMVSSADAEYEAVLSDPPKEWTQEEHRAVESEVDQLMAEWDVPEPTEYHGAAKDRRPSPHYAGDNPYSQDGSS
jgi:hypothetical protein